VLTQPNRVVRVCPSMDWDSRLYSSSRQREAAGGNLSPDRTVSQEVTLTVRGNRVTMQNQTTGVNSCCPAPLHPLPLFPCWLTPCWDAAGIIRMQTAACITPFRLPASKRHNGTSQVGHDTLIPVTIHIMRHRMVASIMAIKRQVTRLRRLRIHAILTRASIWQLTAQHRTCSLSGNVCSARSSAQTADKF
jgi:hypothetical protein